MSGPEKHVVMIVEDDPDSREILSELVADEGFATMTAANGREALDELQSLQTNSQAMPCLILLDMMMPVLDGWQFRAAQRTDPAIAEIPVVILSAHADAGQAARTMHAAGFLRKPIEFDKLVALIRSICS